MTEQYSQCSQHPHHENSSCPHCAAKSSIHKECHSEHPVWAEKLLGIADEAWREVLKEKIKVNIEKEKGEHLDQLAKIIGKANAAKWEHKINAKMKCEEFQNSLKEFFINK